LRIPDTVVEVKMSDIGTSDFWYPASDFPYDPARSINSLYLFTITMTINLRQVKFESEEKLKRRTDL